ncbi:uncharacterized protein MCAP_0864-like [Euwallacea similis]|uniref:uncharacterized protein MCAP_0864-like n=1 Tax=Euwallacea similis TaxID=1736056 RepID=UPI00344E2DA0
MSDLRQFQNEMVHCKQKSTFKSLEEFETAFRQINTELCVKRKEVVKLRSQLEETQHENYNLKESFEKLNGSSEEKRITLELLRVRIQDLEPKLFDKRNAFAKLEMQYKMEMVKNKTLKEDSLRVAKERGELIRKIEVLEEKAKHDKVYINDISYKLSQFKNVISYIRDDLRNMKENYHSVILLSQNLDSIKESIRKYEELSNINENLKKEKSKLEEEAISYKTKFEKLESFFNSNEYSVVHMNLMAKMLLVRCKKQADHYVKIMQTKNEIINNLNSSLQQETRTNIKLIQQVKQMSKQNELLTVNISELEAKLLNMNVIEQPIQKDIENTANIDLNSVKKEIDVVHIVDSQ